MSEILFAVFWAVAVIAVVVVPIVLSRLSREDARQRSTAEDSTVWTRVGDDLELVSVADEDDDEDR